MNHPTRPKARPPTPAEIAAEQRRDAERNTAAKAAPAKAAPVPAVVSNKAALPAAPDTRTFVQRYLDEVSPVSIVGRMVKFDTKGSRYFTPDDDEAIGEDTIFGALCDQTLVGWLRFNGEGQPPDRIMGLLYDGFLMPPRDTLGDADPTQWEVGLSGQPADPWQHHMYLPLQNPETDELFTLVTSSITGRRAIGNLLRHYDRVQKTDSSFYPLVKLKVGGFNHRDERIGWVPVPVLAVTGRMPRVDAAKPTSGGNSGDFNDNIPY
jgi:hypothetical protein